MTPLVTTEEIALQTKILGRQIADLHQGDSTPIVMLCLLAKRWIHVFFRFGEGN